MKKLEIRSSEWYRGKQYSGLVVGFPHKNTLQMCCLGICAVRTHGLPADDLRKFKTPSDIADDYDMAEKLNENPSLKEYLEAWAFYHDPIEHWDMDGWSNTDDTKLAMHINDAINYGELRSLATQPLPDWVDDRHYTAPVTDDDRIALLRPIFERAGYEIVWLPEE